MDLIPYVPRYILIIAHLFGVVVGAGAAVMSYFIYFASVRDRIITKDEMRFIRLSTQVVWLGLLFLFVSGMLLTLKSPEWYLQSSKFQAKITLVLILTFNHGLIQKIHLPNLKKPSKKTNWQARLQYYGLFVSAAVAGCSWMLTVILGSLARVQYSFLEIMLAYLVLVGIVTVVLYGFREQITPKR